MAILDDVTAFEYDDLPEEEPAKPVEALESRLTRFVNVLVEVHYGRGLQNEEQRQTIEEALAYVREHKAKPEPAPPAEPAPTPSVARRPARSYAPVHATERPANLDVLPNGGMAEFPDE